MWLHAGTFRQPQLASAFVKYTKDRQGSAVDLGRLGDAYVTLILNSDVTGRFHA